MSQPYEQTRMTRRHAEADRDQARERLNRLIGVFGKDTQWQMADRLADVPEEPLNLEHLETQAIEASFDLAVAAQRIMTAGHRLGIDESTALVPELNAGVQAARNGDWAMHDDITMGGMFTILKVREELEEDDADPGWYENPQGTQTKLATDEERQRDGIDVDSTGGPGHTNHDGH